MIQAKYFNVDMTLNLSESIKDDKVEYKAFEPRRGLAFWFLTDPHTMSKLD